MLTSHNGTASNKSRKNLRGNLRGQNVETDTQATLRTSRHPTKELWRQMRGIEMALEGPSTPHPAGYPVSSEANEQTEITERLTGKLKVTSRRLQIVALALVVFTPLVVILGVLTGSWIELLPVPPGISIDTARITDVGFVALLAVGSIKPAAYMWAFWCLYRLLGLYRQGIIFTVANVAAIRKIGWSLVIIDVAAMTQTLLAGPVLSIFQITEGHIGLTLEVAFLTVGLFMVLVAHVMDLGQELKKQNDLVI